MAAPVESPSRHLREFHRIGRELLKYSRKFTTSHSPDRKNYGGVNEQIQEDYGLSLNSITSARRFAELYDQADLNDLCRLGRTEGKPLTKSHVCSLIYVGDKQARKRLAARASRKEWSVVRLRIEVAAASPKARSKGRGKQPKLAGPVHALFHSRELALKWINWCACLRWAAQEKDGSAADKQLASLLARRKLATLLKHANAAMIPLRKEVERLIAERPRAARQGSRQGPVTKRRGKAGARRSHGSPIAHDPLRT